MSHCCIPGCKSRFKKGVGKFCRYPRESKRKDSWTNAIRDGINDDKWEPKDSSYLCKEHFEDQDFENNRQDGKKFLKKNSIPSLFSYGDLDYNPNVQIIFRPSDNQHSYCRRPTETETGINVFTTENLQPVPDEPLSLSEYPPTATQSGDTRVNVFTIENLQLVLEEPESPPAAPLTPKSGETGVYYAFTTENLQPGVLEPEPLSESPEPSSISPPLTPKSKKIWDLEKQLEKSERLLNITRRANAKLRHDEWKRKKVNYEEANIFLEEDQLKRLGRKSSRGEWSNTTIKKALRLYIACGKTGYEELLEQKYPLPSLRTLQRSVEYKDLKS